MRLDCRLFFLLGPALIGLASRHAQPLPPANITRRDLAYVADGHARQKLGL